jgi:hypothetical protein
MVSFTFRFIDLTSWIAGRCQQVAAFASNPNFRLGYRHSLECAKAGIQADHQLSAFESSPDVARQVYSVGADRFG